MTPGTTHSKRISAGFSFMVCLLLLAAMTFPVYGQSSVWAWGQNTYGELGDGTTTLSPPFGKSTPVQVKEPEGNGFLTDVTSIAGGLYFSLTLKSDGTVWAWGDNDYGRLGDGTITGRLYPTQVKGTGGLGFLTNVLAISCGTFHAIALKADRTVWAWGSNLNSQIGDGILGGTLDNYRTTPVQVRDPEGVGFLSRIVAVACGHGHSVALRSDGTVWTWGSGRLGELGNGWYGSMANSPLPVQVHGPRDEGYLTNIVSIAAGAGHTLALKADGTVWAWGNGYSTTPTQMRDSTGFSHLSDVIEIATNHGAAHNMALRADGTLLAWGMNRDGQLGDGSTTDRILPVRVRGLNGEGYLSHIVSIKCGGVYSIALREDGTVWTWGSNAYGQLGDSTTVQRLTPVPTSLLHHIVSAAGSTFHSLALKSVGVFQGSVTLDGSLCLDTSMRFEFRPAGGGEAIVRTVKLGQAGTFSFFDIPPGNYNVAVKGSKWLQKVVPDVDTSGGNNILNLHVNLIGGDANDDNSIDVLDLDVLIQAFDSTPSDPNWNEGADFNGDNSVDVLDLDILLRNFDLQGDL